MSKLNTGSLGKQSEEIRLRWRRIKKSFVLPSLDGRSGQLTEPTKLLLLIVLIALFATWVYEPVLSAQVVGLDDHQYLMNNPLVRNPSIDSIGRLFSEVLNPSTVSGYYQPLTMISFMFDYLLDPQFENLRTLHRTNLILHIMTMAAISVFIFLLFKNIWAAAAVGLLFVLHPMTVEPVAWVAERKTLLAAFFSVVSLIYYTQFRYSKKRVSFLLALVFYLTALLSKPSSLPLPFLMLLIDYWPLQQLNRKCFIEKWPFFILALLFGAITFFSQRNAAGVTLPDHNPIFTGSFSFITVIQMMAHNFVFYLTKIIWPVNLMIRYPIPTPFGFENPVIIVETIIFSIIIIFSLIMLKRTRSFLTAILFFLFAVSPTMGIIGFTTVLTADIYAYFPALGFLMLLAWGTAKIISRPKSKKQQLFLWIIISSVLLSLSLCQAKATRSYLALWQKSELLNRYMLKLDPQNPQLYILLAITLREEGKNNEEIISLYSKAIELTPNDLEINDDLGNFYISIGEYNEGIRLFEKSIALGSRSPMPYANLGIAYFHKKEYDKAVDYLKKALEITPEAKRVYLILGDVYRAQGKRAIADEYYKKALTPETPKK